MALIVQKYGDTSVSTRERRRQVMDKVIQEKKKMCIRDRSIAELRKSRDKGRAADFSERD